MSTPDQRVGIVPRLAHRVGQLGERLGVPHRIMVRPMAWDSLQNSLAQARGIFCTNSSDIPEGVLSHLIVHDTSALHSPKIEGETGEIQAALEQTGLAPFFNLCTSLDDPTTRYVVQPKAEYDGDVKEKLVRRKTPDGRVIVYHRFTIPQEKRSR